MRLTIIATLLASRLIAASPVSDVKAVMLRQQDAWNHGDLNAFMQEYLHSPELTFVGKNVTRGWQDTLDRYRRTYPTSAAMGHLTFSELEVHPLGKSHAWVMGRYHLERTAAGGGNSDGRYTLIFAHTKSGWKIMLDHTSVD